MNVSKLNNPFTFNDNNESLFKVQTNECGLPSKIVNLLKFDNGEFSFRFCNEWIICVGNGSMLIWKHSLKQKNFISSCIEFQIPQCTSGQNANQVLIVNGMDHIIITNDGHVRYWPRLLMPLEYLDGHINGLSNDECLLVEKLSDGVVVAVFRSKKIIVIDLRDSSESGLSIKTFKQPRGFINGMSRYLSSFIISNINDGNNFKNIKVNNLLTEETEVLIMVDNNIDSLSVDVLFNGQYKREILPQDTIKKYIFKALFAENLKDFNELSLMFGNFDLCRNIIYVLVKVETKDIWHYVLFTYNRKMDDIDSMVKINVNLVGDIELNVITDESADNDEPCLLVALKDNHSIYVVEVLTGIVKCELNTELPQSNTLKTIIGWTCPSFINDPNTIVVVLTASKHLLSIKQNINPLGNQSFATNRRGDTDLDFNLSNASFSDWNTSKISFLHPAALSTPISKFDHKGDRAKEILNSSIKKNDTLNASTTSIGVIDQICQDTSAFGTFKKSVVLYWLGYKSQAKRVLGPVIERAQVNNDISLSLFVLQIAREIIDEYPGKDPRWTNIISTLDTKGFLYSNKSLLLPQQLHAKKEALQKLIIMLKDNNVNVFDSVGNIAPMSVSQSLHMQIQGLKSFGSGQVAWSVVHSIGLGIEMLEFVRVFNEILVGESVDEINQILAKCCQHVLALQRKLTPLDIISQEVSLIPRFLRQCSDYLKDRHFSGDTKPVFTLLGKIISGCLKSSLNCRRQYEESFLSITFDLGSYGPSVAASCWITENQPIGVLDSLVDIINSLLDFSIGSHYHAFDSAIDITTVLLECFKYRLTWMEEFSRNNDEFVRIEDVYGTVRAQLIAKMVEVNGSLDTALDIADRFGDFYWMTSICETLDCKSDTRDICHLEPYLRKWCNEGLSEFVLDWYQDRLKDVDTKNQGKLLAKIQTILEKVQKIEGTNTSMRMDTSSSSQVIGKFLEKAEVQATRWLHDIETGEFSQAATSLRRLAEAEELSLARRKTLLGLAKLNYLANTDMSTEETETAVETMNKYLELVHFQEEIPGHVIESQLALTQGTRSQPVIGTAQIVKLYLATVATSVDVKKVGYFVQALSLMDFAERNRDLVAISEKEWMELLLTVWMEIVGHDDWTKQTIETSCQTSMTARVYKAAKDRGLSGEVMRPDLRRLFEGDVGGVYGADAEFLIRGTFECLCGCVDTGDDMLCD